jgi:hypothetical protein
LPQAPAEEEMDFQNEETDESRPSQVMRESYNNPMAGLGVSDASLETNTLVQKFDDNRRSQQLK